MRVVIEHDRMGQLEPPVITLAGTVGHDSTKAAAGVFY